MRVPSRRTALKILGSASAGLVVVAGGAHLSIPALPHRRAPTAADAAAWLRLTPTGLIEVIMPRAELGQGVAIAFRQIAAEETGFPLDRVRAVQPRTDQLPAVRATAGSDSIREFAPLLAEAASKLAQLLKLEGSEGGVPPSGGWSKLAFPPQLINITASRGAPTTFSSRAKRVVGTCQPTDQVRAIVTAGAPLFSDDVRHPNMIFGAVLRAPRLGAVLVHFDDTAARLIPGFLELYRIGNRVFVTATSRSSLERALAAISTTWSGGLTQPADMLETVDIDKALARGRLEHVKQDAAFGAEEQFSINIRVDVPLAAHAAMEPRCAVAKFTTEGHLRVWTGTQDVTFVRAVLAKELGLDLSQVTVIGCRVGGGFGGKTTCTVELEAALLARVSHRPVKIQWSRQDEFRQAFHRPPSSHRVRARLTSDGRIDAWHHAFRSGHVIFTSAAIGPALQFATSFVSDPGVARGATTPYAAGKTRIEFGDVRLKVQTGPWRGLGAAPNNWAIETAIDHLARERDEDPLAFRIRNIDARWPRLKRALHRVAKSAGWPTLTSSDNLGYGMACGVYKEMSYVAVIAEVRRSGDAVSVSRLWCAHDCGLMINPDQIRAQIEGNLVWGIGMALGEELTVEEGHIAQSSFTDYHVPRFSAVPEMFIELIEEGDSPTGSGETAIIATTPAICNAIAAMTGEFVNRLPYRPRSVA